MQYSRKDLEYIAESILRKIYDLYGITMGPRITVSDHFGMHSILEFRWRDRGEEHQWAQALPSLPKVGPSETQRDWVANNLTQELARFIQDVRLRQRPAKLVEEELAKARAVSEYYYDRVRGYSQYPTTPEEAVKKPNKLLLICT